MEHLTFEIPYEISKVKFKKHCLNSGETADRTSGVISIRWYLKPDQIVTRNEDR